MTLLIDTSVVVKWIVAEEGSDIAMTFHGSDLAAPGLMLLELGNVLWMKVRSGEMLAAQAIAGLTEVGSVVRTLSTDNLQLRALEIGIDLNHPVYDCAYLALAEAGGMRVLTADKRLVKSAANTAFADLLLPLV